MQKHPRCKKGEAKSEAPKVILFMYSTKKIDIMQVEVKACLTDRIVQTSQQLKLCKYIYHVHQ